MEHRLLASIEELLSPATLSVFEGKPVTSVATMPFGSVDSLSGSHFLSVTTTTGGRYILKRINREWDWVMRASSDNNCRAVLCWQDGLLDRLPNEIEHGIVACSKDGDGWALLMHDFTDFMIPPGDDEITIEANANFIEGMAALQAAFWEEPQMAGDPSPGYATLIEHFKTLSLETGRLEADNHPVPPMITKGWALLEKLTAPEVALVLRALLSDFTPLVRALERYPQTVVHGDWKLGNLGIMPAHARTILLDWAMIGRAPAALELGWYLAVNSARLPVTKEEAIDSYRQGLARRLGSRFSDSWWRPQLELSLLGSFLKLGWTKLLGTEEGETLDIRSRERVELEWWSQRALAGSKYL